MAFLFYVRLIVLTAGTLVYLFLIALVLGHRRPRKFERLLFFLIFSLFLIYAGGLLEINAVIEYGSPSAATRLFANLLTVIGKLSLLPLIWHVNVEYVRTVQGKRVSRMLWNYVAVMYALVLGEVVFAVIVSHRVGESFGGFLVDF